MNSDELENQQRPGCLYLGALMKRQKGGPEDDARKNLVDRGMKENSSMILRRFPTHVAVGLQRTEWTGSACREKSRHGIEEKTTFCNDW